MIWKKHNFHVRCNRHKCKEGKRPKENRTKQGKKGQTVKSVKNGEKGRERGRTEDLFSSLTTVNVRFSLFVHPSDYYILKLCPPRSRCSGKWNNSLCLLVAGAVNSSSSDFSFGPAFGSGASCLGAVHRAGPYASSVWSIFPFMTASARLLLGSSTSALQDIRGSTRMWWMTGIKYHRVPAVYFIHRYPVSPASFNYSLSTRQALWLHASCNFGHANLVFDVLMHVSLETPIFFFRSILRTLVNRKFYLMQITYEGCDTSAERPPSVDPGP